MHAMGVGQLAHEISSLKKTHFKISSCHQSPLWTSLVHSVDLNLLMKLFPIENWSALMDEVGSILFISSQ